jgi:hypothetical protein
MVKVNRMAPAVGQASVPLTDQFYGVESITFLQLVTKYTALYYLRFPYHIRQCTPLEPILNHLNPLYVFRLIFS